MAGQSINDRLTAARYSLAGQGLAKSVCKATTEEVIGPKKKHLDYLIHCTNEPNVSIPQLANLLIERTQSASWVIVFKGLITVHHMMCYGNERFTQYLASSNCNFNLGGFLDKSGSTGVGGQSQPQMSYDMSTFIRRYAKYINEKAISYRSVAFDFCKTKRGKEDGTLRTLPTDNLLKTLPILQAQLDALLDFDCTASELGNGVINSAFMLLFRDLIRLFACYNDGIINLLEKFFEMNKKQARDALDCYKKFLIRMDRVAEFLKVAESIGMDKSEIPDLKQAPSSLLDALEAHLASLEGKKPPPPSGGPKESLTNLKSAMTLLSNTSSSFGLACSNGRVEGTNGSSSPVFMDEAAKRAALAEEDAMYEKLKTDHSKNNPFLSSPATETATGSEHTNGKPNVVDFFAQEQETGANVQQTSTKASDDLLQLGNPFADMMSGAAAQTAPPQMHQPYTNGFGNRAPFVTDNSFDAVFGQNPNCHQTFDGFGSILQPVGSAAGGAPPTGMSAPVAQQAPKQASGKLITGDLDMSLSSLVDNLNIKGPAQKPQWSSPKSQSKTGGAGWSPAMSTSTGAAPAPQAGFNYTPGVAQGGAPMMAQNMGGIPGIAPAMNPQPAVVASGGAPAPSAAFDPFGAL